MPDVSAVAEMLPGFNNTTWYGLLAPAGTPAPIVNRVNEPDPLFRVEPARQSGCQP